MKFSRLHLLAAPALLSCTIATAQVRYCVGGDLDHLSASQRKQCDAKLQAVRGITSSLKAPADWHFVVVCGEQGWKDYAAYAAMSGDAVEESQAATDLQQHETFFREASLNISDAQSLQRLVVQEVSKIAHRQEQVASLSGASRNSATRIGSAAM